MLGQRVSFRLTCLRRLLQCTEHEISRHQTADAPADGVPGKDVGDEGRVDEALQGRDASEIADPHLVRSLGFESVVDPIEHTWGLGIGYRCANDLAAYHTAQPSFTQQPFDRTVNHIGSLTLQPGHTLSDP